MSRLANEQGQEIYYHVVVKHGKERSVVKGINCEIRDRDGRRHRSRTFAQHHQAEAWLRRHGFIIPVY